MLCCVLEVLYRVIDDLNGVEFTRRDATLTP